MSEPKIGDRLKEIGRALLAILPPRSVLPQAYLSLPGMRRVLTVRVELEHAVAVLRACGWTIDQAHEATQEALQEEIDFVRSTVYPFSLERLRKRLRVHQDRAASGELPDTGDQLNQQEER